MNDSINIRNSRKLYNLLYRYRKMDQKYSYHELSKKTGINFEDVKTAVNYLLQNNYITEEFDQISRNHGYVFKYNIINLWRKL